MGDTRLMGLGHSSCSLMAVLSSQQDDRGGLLAGQDGLLFPIGVPISKGGVEPGCELCTEALFLELRVTSPMLASGSLEALHLGRWLLASEIGSTTNGMRWPCHSLRSQRLSGWINDVLFRPKDSFREAWIACPSFDTAYCLCLQHLNCQSNPPVSWCILWKTPFPWQGSSEQYTISDTSDLLVVSVQEGLDEVTKAGLLTLENTKQL